MHLHSLKLSNFKNYEAQAFEFSARLNCLVGLNGMGKTNVLDAIHFVCLTKSHSGLPDKNLIRHGEGFFRVEAQFLEKEQRDQVVVKMAAGQRKNLEKNGGPVQRLADFVGQYPVVMVAPDDLSLVQEGSEDRRRFIDGTLSQISPGYLDNLLLYNALIKQRNALLKHFAETQRFDAALLEAIDRQIPAPAQLLFEARQQFAVRFQPLFLACYAEISGDREQVEVRYEADQANADMAQLLVDGLSKDRILQRTSAGPHKDDLALFMDGQPVKRFASQGQMKSFLLALRLAQYEVLRAEKGFSPLLLLDDIFDKLDDKRVSQLVGLLMQRKFGQIFITDTQRSRIETIIASFTGDYKVFEIENGGVV